MAAEHDTIVAATTFVAPPNLIAGTLVVHPEGSDVIVMCPRHAGGGALLDSELRTDGTLAATLTVTLTEAVAEALCGERPRHLVARHLAARRLKRLLDAGEELQRSHRSFQRLDVAAQISLWRELCAVVPPIRPPPMLMELDLPLGWCVSCMEEDIQACNFMLQRLVPPGVAAPQLEGRLPSAAAV